MNQLKFIIIEDHPVALQSLRAFLTEAGYAGDTIWPMGAQPTFETWTEVEAKLVALQNDGWSPERDCCVLLVDLALADAPASRGIEVIAASFSGFYRHYVIVAYSQSGANVKGNRHFDGYIHKQDVGQDPRDDAQKVKRAVERAIQKWSARTRRDPPSLPEVRHRLDDSPAARLAEVALGPSSIDYRISTLSTGWTGVSARALTGGLSGAFVLRIDGAGRSVICKVAKEDNVLQRELAAWRFARETTAATHLMSDLQPPQVIPGDAAYYMTLATVPGVTLEQALIGTPLPLDEPTRELVTFLTESARAATPHRTADMLRMKRHELGRIIEAIRMLHELGVACTERGALRTGDMPSRAICEELVAVVNVWPDRLAQPDMAELPGYPQHGDLHARNILISANGRPVLIDWARYGPWPMAYDVQRLELQLLVRVFRTGRMADQFIDGVAPLWPLLSELLDDDLARPLTVSDPNDAPVIQQLERLRQARATVLDDAASGLDRMRRLRAFHVGRCHDALRAAAYQDVSPFKRLFALYAAIVSARAAGLLTTTP